MYRAENHFTGFRPASIYQDNSNAWLARRKEIVLALLAATARLKPERLASPTVARR